MPLSSLKAKISQHIDPFKNHATPAVASSASLDNQSTQSLAHQETLPPPYCNVTANPEPIVTQRQANLDVSGESIVDSENAATVKFKEAEPLLPYDTQKPARSKVEHERLRAALDERERLRNEQAALKGQKPTSTTDKSGHTMMGAVNAGLLVLGTIISGGSS